MMQIERFPSPIGEIVVGAVDTGIMLCSFGEFFGGVLDEDGCADDDHHHEAGCGCELHRPSKRTAQTIKLAGKALKSYFAGNLSAFEELPVVLMGTPFQRSVWGALKRIQPGRTKSYGEISSAVKRPNAVRAVGNACGANPVVLIVPCHRVVASSGGLGGFSGGLHRKEFLLDFEADRTGQSRRTRRS